MSSTPHLLFIQSLMIVTFKIIFCKRDTHKEWLTFRTNHKIFCISYIQIRNGDSASLEHYSITDSTNVDFSHKFPGHQLLHYNKCNPITMQSIFQWEPYCVLDPHRTIYLLTYDTMKTQFSPYHCTPPT